VIIGNSGDVIQVPDGRKYHRKNKLNDLPGGQWTFFLNSVINTRFPTSGAEAYAHDLRKIHPSPKPPQLMRDIIEFFTKEDEIVLDYFMGVGGTLIGASLCGRKAIGIDLNQKYLDVYKLANKALGLKEQITLLGNSSAKVKKYNPF
jgi:DNA modification methylase